MAEPVPAALAELQLKISGWTTASGALSGLWSQYLIMMMTTGHEMASSESFSTVALAFRAQSEVLAALAGAIEKAKAINDAVAEEFERLGKEDE